MNNTGCGNSNLMDVIGKGEIYLTFVFDGMDSTQLGVASVTGGGTYDTPILPSFTDNSLEVDGYDGRYYFNTQITQKEFSYSCFIDDLSAFEFEQLKSWIRPRKIAKLIRPEEPYRYYWVKVASIDNLGNIPRTHSETGGVSYTGSFNITFATVGQACGNGMFYYQNDLKYFEYRDIFSGNEAYYYDAGLLYQEESLPLKMTQTAGIWDPQIYNPGTYSSKVRLKITPSADIEAGVITVTNETVGDMGIINLVNLKANDELIIDWGTNQYTLNGEDYVDKVVGDLIFLQPRNYVERVLGASITNDGTSTRISFDPMIRQVRTLDIGKTVMFKQSGIPQPENGAGGRIKSIDSETNAFILEGSAGLFTNTNTEVIITLLDNLKSEIVIPDGVTLDIDWQIEPRYL